MKIAVVTGARSEYGLLEPLIKVFHEAPDVELLLFVTGSHLSPQFGSTVNDIHYPITERIEILLASSSPVAINKAMGLAMISFGEAHERHRPDLVVVLGDRFESFCAACAAHVSDIPIAHIHGGELTEGSMDDAFRHSITKMAAIHFCAAEPFAKRIQQLGEDPKRIYNVGALGCQNLRKRAPSPAAVFAVVCHYSVEGLREIFSVLKEKEIPHIAILPVSDIGTGEVREIIKSLTKAYDENLSRDAFLAYLVKYAKFMVGNSSAAVIEAPCLGVPSINVGDRQKGRPQAASVIQSDPTEKSISGAIDVVYSPEFEGFIETNYPVYYQGGPVARAIADILLREIPNLKATGKRFYDIER